MSYPLNINGVTYQNETDLAYGIAYCEQIIENPHAYHASEIVGAAQSIPVLRAALGED